MEIQFKFHKDNIINKYKLFYSMNDETHMV